MTGYSFSKRTAIRQAGLLMLAVCFFSSSGLARDGAQNVTRNVDQTGAQTDGQTRGRQVYRAACSTCHGLGAIEATRDGKAGWEKTVYKMVGYGAQLSVEEMALVIDYLAANLGPGAGPMKTGLLPPASPLQSDGKVTSANVQLPDGQGKELVEGYCQMCHDLGRVVATPRSEQDWRRYARLMPARAGIVLSEQQQESLVAYLDGHFGKKQDLRDRSAAEK